jgi:Sec-independent protein secretion pathway components
MGALSPLHLIIIGVVALLVIGPGKLPETSAALGKAVRDFHRAVTEDVTDAKPPNADRPTEITAATESPPAPNTLRNAP